MGNKNKDKGSRAEREYANFYKKVGFPFCKTSRQTSRLLDDCGVDLTGIPHNVQIKAGVHKNMNPALVLSIIKERLPENFPPEDSIHDKPSILIHHKQGSRGKRRTGFDTIVYISKLDIEKYFLPKYTRDTLFMVVYSMTVGHKRLNYTEVLKECFEKTIPNKVETICSILRYKKRKGIPDDNEFCSLYIMTIDDFKILIKHTKRC